MEVKRSVNIHANKLLFSGSQIVLLQKIIGMKFGVIREGKFPPDKRVALTPLHCQLAMKKYPELEIVVQPSEIRAFKDEEYAALGVKIQEDLSDCDVLIGVKEVNIEDLIANKKYLFFSHTYKLQPYNKGLLQAILDKNIRLIDYEVMTKKGERIIAFGRYAGIVGAYNGLRAWGAKFKSFNLKPAYQCEDMKDMLAQLSNLRFERPIKILITGKGRVAGGAIEVLNHAGIPEVSSKDYQTKSFDHSVYTVLSVEDYNERRSDGGFSKNEFYADPSEYQSKFMQYAPITDFYIACHYWDSRSPFIFSRDDAKSDDFKIKIVADISCDIDGPVASTLRPSTIEDPFYGYDAANEAETDFSNMKSIGIMAVDNLPCELPKDASISFADSFVEHIIPALLGNDPEGIIQRASETTLNGDLSEHFSYLEDYVS